MPSSNPNEVVSDTDNFPNTQGLMEFAEKKTTSSQPPGVLPSPPPSRRKDHSVDAKRQASRIRRLLLVAVFGFCYLIGLACLHVAGMVDRATLSLAAAAVILIMAGFFGIFAAGFNQKAKEKNLTAPIAWCAVAILLGVLYSAPESRMLFVPFSFVLMAHGMYRLTRNTLMMMASALLTGYAGVIGLHSLQPIDPQAWKLPWLEWLALALTLPAFVVLTTRIRRLHSALHKAGRKIRHIEEHARRDQLLGCYNRRYLIAALDEQKRLADETGAPLCLGVIDLDHFKSINDEVGHLAGDEVLRTFARIAESNVRQGDVFGRYGGEEFVLILPQTPLLAALNTAERIREQVEQHGWQGKSLRTVTVSIGLTQYIPGESVLDLFARTDTAMYLAKRGGRNQVVVEESSIELWQATEADMQY
ncbi:MAG TPA: GGDEF domain-containing protein [Noviherbaspirillum sp.]|jgi:diguanylate cyclase (GGDEF)-like protein|uniref:GGDEF domain-containing protein n=1 Tax=Noviherbaspirillum sp. TaxID=1926288 RepID=UPI002DDCF63D|nr:GGDEF domain-containing protein [Noviherbaspirillum sp.]HEV2609639.1 GGDEF domain-containing protein [Noviherbaspirillum sp.]